MNKNKLMDKLKKEGKLVHENKGDGGEGIKIKGGLMYFLKHMEYCAKKFKTQNNLVYF